MRLLFLLLLPTVLLAAPVPRSKVQPRVELELSAQTRDVLHIRVQNNEAAPLVLNYRRTPLEHFAIQLRSSGGRQCMIQHTADEKDGQTPTQQFTIPPGEARTLILHTCHYMPELGHPGEAEAVTYRAWLILDGMTVASPALTK